MSAKFDAALLDVYERVETVSRPESVMLPPRKRLHTALNGCFATLCGVSLDGARLATSDENCFSQKCGRCELEYDLLIFRAASTKGKRT